MSFFLGTGSCPYFPQGLQRKILFSPSKEPLIAPCNLIASSVYTEQHGEKRHEPVGPKKAFLIGDKITRYSLINSMSNLCRFSQVEIGRVVN